MKVGVLALQGDFSLHRKALERVGVESVEVRMPRQLDDVAGLIMPGGESTTLLKLMDAWDFVPALEKFHAAGRPIFGTCAGMILLASEVLSPAQFSLGFIDLTVERNAYGRQKESFESLGFGDRGQGPRDSQGRRRARSDAAVLPARHRRARRLAGGQGRPRDRRLHPGHRRDADA